MDFINRALQEKTRAKTPSKSIDGNSLAKELNIALAEFNLILENRNSLLYKVKTFDDRQLILKQTKSLTPKEINDEYNSLVYYNSLDIIGLKTPKAIKFLPEYNAYVMEFVAGENLNFQIIGSNTNLMSTLKQTAPILAKLHMKEFVGASSIYHLNILFEDLETDLLRFSKHEKRVLCKAKDSLIGHSFPVGYSYQDFSPLNLYFAEGVLTLIDPPRTKVESFLFRDLATFSVGLRKALLLKNPRTLFFTKQHTDSMEVFISRYIESLQVKTSVAPSEKIHTLFYLLVIQRLAEMIVFQNNKLQRLSKVTLKTRTISFLTVKYLRHEIHRIIRKTERLLKQV